MRANNDTGLEEDTHGHSKNGTLIRHLFEDVLNGGKMDIVDEIISVEYVECCPRGADGY
jgi:hypothetical protein